MGAWSKDSKTSVAHMDSGDFYESEISYVLPKDDVLQIIFEGKDGSKEVLKSGLKVLKDEVIDASFMSSKKLGEFYEKMIEEAKDEGVLLSLHLKATMMKISDPIMFGIAVKSYFKELFAKHAETFEKLGVNVNNGFGDLVSKIATLDEKTKSEIEKDIKECLSTNASIAMVDSDKGITNLHVPSDVIIDASSK